MDEQKELQTNSTPSYVPPSTPIPSGIPHDASLGMETHSSEIQKENHIEVSPDIEIPTLRTYKSDINQTVNRDKISTAKILIAEQNRQRVTDEKIGETSIKRPTNILVLFLSIILVLASLVAIGYFGYTKIIVKTIEPITVPSSFLFIFDQERLIEVPEDSLNIAQDVQKQMDALMDVKNETYTDIIFYKKNNNTKENERINSLDFFMLYDISLPTNIKRSISNSFVYGAYKTENRIEPFLVLGINDYETMYTSMFVWENTLALDIRDLFPTLRELFDLTRNRPTPESINTGTTTQATSTSISATSTLVATSTVTTTNEITPEEQLQLAVEETTQINRTIRFIDIIFSNKDARAVRDPNGTPFFYYAFIDKTKILFAQDPKLLNEIIRKIKEKNLVR